MDDGLRVISEESSRKDLLSHIRALEARLECDRVYRIGGDEGKTPENPLGAIAEEVSPAERVRMIRAGSDGIGCRDVAIALLEAALGQGEDAEGGAGKVSFVEGLLQAAKVQGYVDGYRTAREDVARFRASADGRDISHLLVVDMMDDALRRYQPAAEEAEATLSRVRLVRPQGAKRPE